MTPREIERAIQFILQQAANAEARHEQFKAEEKIRHEQVESELRALTRQTAKTSANVDAVSKTVAQLAESVSTLRDSTRDLADHARWTDSRIRRLENPGT